MLRSFVREESLHDETDNIQQMHTCHSNVQNSEMTNQKYPPTADETQKRKTIHRKPKISAYLSTLFLTSM
jgi:hypothetical protein